MKLQITRFMNGRSMIEMLGVLAIIGILSIGAVMGLRYAFDKIKANEIFKTTQLIAFHLQEREIVYPQYEEITIPAELTQESGYNYTAMQVMNNVMGIYMFPVSEGVCHAVLSSVGERFDIAVNGTFYETDKSICRDDSTLQFYFGQDMGMTENFCDPLCNSGEVCINRACCPVLQACSDKCCAAGKVCSNETCCADGETGCGSYCCGEDTNGVLLACDGAGGCKCPAEDMTMTAGACGCPSARPYFFDALHGGPLCCASGYVPQNGKCTQFYCHSGTTGKTFSCVLDGTRCGSGCLENGSSCTDGLCMDYQCPAGSTFTNESFLGLGACKKDGFLYIPSGASYIVFEGNNRNACCVTNAVDKNCISGSCFDNPCPTGATMTYIGTSNRARKGCQLREDLACYLASGKWSCFKNGVACGSGCADPLECGECNQNCPTGTTEETLSGGGYQCCEGSGADKICCSNQTCYREGKLCGAMCGWTQSSCVIKNCDNPCTAGFTYQFNDYANSWGCQKGDLFCRRPGSCYYGSQQCGTGCQIDGTNCLTYSQEACAPTDTETGKKFCVTGKPVTDTCVCASDKTLAAGELCCASGYTPVNGTCTKL